jgi:hypothetical protein
VEEARHPGPLPGRLGGGGGGGGGMARAVGERCPHGRGQGLGRRPLGEVAGGPGGAGGGAVLTLGVHAHHQHRHRGLPAAQLAQRLEPAPVGQGQIQQHQVPALLPDPLEGLLGAAGLTAGHRGQRSVEGVPHRAAHLRVVVDDQHAH